MAITYAGLIADHDRIDEAAELILDIIHTGVKSGALLAGKLSDLAGFVGRHIRDEEAFVGALEQERLVGEWLARWKRGMADFDRLCNEWRRFIEAWSATAIDHDYDGFVADADIVLGQLRARMQDETNILYRTALQTGAIRLR